MIACMEEANRLGLKLALYGLNAGTPEWWEMQAMVESGVFAFARQYGHIMTMHEGVFKGETSWDDPIDLWAGHPIPANPEKTQQAHLRDDGLHIIDYHDTDPNNRPDWWDSGSAGSLCLRYRYLYYLIPEQDRIPLVISEIVLGGGYSGEIAPDDVVDRLRWYDDEVAKDWYVWSFLPFTLGGHSTEWGNRDYDFAYPAIVDYMIDVKDKVNAVAPPVVPPVDDGYELVLSLNFPHNGEWSNQGNVQVPSGWTYYQENGNNPYTDGNPVNDTFVAPEGRHLDETELPPEEHHWLNDVGSVWKLFAERPFDAGLFKGLQLASGSYILRIDLQADWFTSIDDDGNKVYEGDPHGQVIKLIGDAVEQWYYPEPLGNNVIEWRFSVDSPRWQDVGFGVLSKYAIRNNAFIRSFSVYHREVVMPPKYKKIIHLLPQDTTPDEWAHVTGLAFVPKQTVAFSADDVVGLFKLDDTRDDSYCIAYGGEDRWGGVDIAEWLIMQGVFFVVSADFPPPPPPEVGNPLDGLVLGAPFRIPFSLVFGAGEFNAPRGYGNGLHEGADYDILNGIPDSMEPVLAMYDGVVVDPSTLSGYGNHVVLQHYRNNAPFRTLMAHMDALFVSVGQQVVKGQPLGEIGATGLAQGEHVHINLEVPNHGASGYVRPDVVNPVPYISTEPAPDVTQTQFGIHGSADPLISDDDIAMIVTMRPETIKVLSSVNRDSLQRLVNACNEAEIYPDWIIRAYVDFNRPEVVTPQNFYDWTIDDVVAILDIIDNPDGVGHETSICIEIHNEPNLTGEGLGKAWVGGVTFALWYDEVYGLYADHDRVSRYGLMFPAMSPGESIDGIRMGHKEFLTGCREAIEGTGLLGVHGYWAHNYPMSATLAMIDWYVDQYPTVKLFVTEASNNTRFTSADDKAQEYLQFWTALGERQNVVTVTYFVLSASNPAWGWSTGSGEVWTQEMADRVAQRLPSGG
jgi:hypothetical protein